MRLRILTISILFVLMLAVNTDESTFAQETQTKPASVDVKLRELLPSTTFVYAEIEKPLEFLQKFAKWEYIETMLKLNLKSEDVPYIGDLYQAFETVKILGEALQETGESTKESMKIEVLKSIEIAMPTINLMNLGNPDFTENLIVFIKTHRFADVLTQLILLLQTQIEKFEIIKVEQYKGTAMIEINAEDTKIFITMIKNGQIMLTWNKNAATKLIDKIIAPKMTNNLANSKIFKSAFNGLTRAKSVPHIKIYVYLKQIMQLLSFMESGSSEQMGEFNPLDLGISDINALSMMLYFEGKKIRESLNVVLSEKRNGIFGFFPTKPCKFNFAKFAPENVSSIYMCQTNVMRLFTNIEALLTKIEPEMAKYLRNFVDSAKTFGYNPIEKAFESLAGEFCFWSIYDEKNKLSEATFLFETNNEKLCEILISEMIQVLQVEFFTSFEKIKYNETDINIVHFEDGLRETLMMLPQNLPAALLEPVEKLIEDRFYDKMYVAVHGEKLIFTSNFDRMKLIIDNPKGVEKSHANSEKIKSTLKKMKDENASSLMYLGDKSFVYGWYDIFNTLLSSTLQESQNIAIKLPSRKVFAESFCPTEVMSIRSFKDSIEINSPGIVTGTAVTL
ncbi:MAG: hypothetical protein K8S87_02255, partial [Planctomycetes bacterium]|nr:hypothetical protein [Planctomycetota bacterium]